MRYCFSLQPSLLSFSWFMEAEQSCASLLPAVHLFQASGETVASHAVTPEPFPNHQVFQVRLVELLLLGFQMEQQALHAPSPPLPPL